VKRVKLPRVKRVKLRLRMVKAATRAARTRRKTSRPSSLMEWIRRIFGAVVGRPAGLKASRFVLVGLGNPGEEYAGTRHNIGYRVADQFAAALNDRRASTGCGSEIVSGVLPGSGLAVSAAKPRTFMNRSGDAVERLLARSQADVASCLVVVDDIHLPVGRMRLRRGGSDGGHNGLKSIIAAVGDGFPRLRVGVGPAPSGQSLIDFVLGPFGDDDESALAELLPRAVQAAACVMEQGIDTAMNTYN
jgi:PTH1 family peptidyl-tRNA hydrolase